MNENIGADRETIDNLTEFEYALAGVTSSGADDNPAIRILMDMRDLMNAVSETPVRSPGLNSFLDDSGGKRRNDRRGSQTPSTKRRRSLPTAGGFVDITPEELLPDQELVQNDLAEFSPADAINFHPDFLNASGYGHADQLQFDQEIDTDRVPPTDDQTNSTGNETANAVTNLDPITDEIADPPNEEPNHHTAQITDEHPETQPDSLTEPEPNHHTAQITDEHPETQPDSLTEPEPKQFSDSSDKTGSDFTETSERPVGLSEDSLVSVPEAGSIVDQGAPAQFVETTPIVSVVDASTDSERSLFDSDLASAATAATNANEGILGGIQGRDLDHSPSRSQEYDAAAVNLLPELAASVTAETRASRSRPATFIWVGALAAALTITVGGLWFLNRPTTNVDENELATSDIGADSVPDVGLDKQPGESTGGDFNSRQESENGADQGQSSEFSQPSLPRSDSSPAPLDDSDGDDDALTVPVADDSVLDSPTTTSDTTASPSTTQTSSTSAQSSSTTTTSQTTSRPTTTIRQTTTRLTTTSRQTTTQPPSTTPPFAYLGNKVYLDQRFGAVSNQASIELHYDTDGDGTPEGFVRRRDLNDSGTYEFEVNAGCFVVRVVPFPGYELVPGNGDLPVCVQPGEINNDLDSVIRRVPVSIDRPDFCYVEVRDFNLAIRGVQITENDQQFAAFYIFYNDRGRIVKETNNIPSEDVFYHNATTREWHDQGNYDSQSVYSAAAADDQGNVSTRISCQR